MTKLHDCPGAARRTLWTIQSDCRTDIAWLPSDAEQGDDICMLAGAPWPFVLRRAQDGSHRLIGDCHVHSTPLIEALGGVYDAGNPEHQFRRGDAPGLNMGYCKLGDFVEILGCIVIS